MMNPAPRIFHLVTKADLAGSQRYVLLCASRSPQDTIIGTGCDGPLVDEARRLGCICEVIPGLSRGLNPLSARQAVSGTIDALNRHGPDIVHTHTSNAGVIGRIASHYVGVPVVHTVHGWQFAAGNSLSVRAISLATEWLMAPLSDAVICVCNADAELARRLAFPCPGRLTVVLNAVCDRQPQRIPGPRLRLGMAARFADQKDQATLIAAMKKTWDVECHFWGDGPNLAICREAAANVPHIYFHGEQRDIPSLLGGVDIMVLSTHYEGLPLCLLEGLAAGLPLIGTNVNGVPETICDGWNGRLVPARDADALAKAIFLYQEHPELLVKHGANSRQLFLERFCPGRFHAALDVIYSTAMARRGRRCRRGHNQQAP